jgi:acetylornithine deacetylase
MVWSVFVEGKGFHSGLPNKAINALELGMEVVAILQKRFYADFPRHPKEEEYNFACSSTMKPTQISVPKGGNNQIPRTCTIAGDIRLTPFYSVSEVKNRVDQYMKEINDVRKNLIVTNKHLASEHLPILIRISLLCLREEIFPSTNYLLKI